MHFFSWLRTLNSIYIFYLCYGEYTAFCAKVHWPVILFFSLFILKKLSPFYYLFAPADICGSTIANFWHIWNTGVVFWNCSLPFCMISSWNSLSFSWLLDGVSYVGIVFIYYDLLVESFLGIVPMFVLIDFTNIFHFWWFIKIWMGSVLMVIWSHFFELFLFW